MKTIVWNWNFSVTWVHVRGENYKSTSFHPIVNIDHPTTYSRWRKWRWWKPLYYNNEQSGIVFWCCLWGSPLKNITGYTKIHSHIVLLLFKSIGNKWEHKTLKPCNNKTWECNHVSNEQWVVIFEWGGRENICNYTQ